MNSSEIFIAKNENSRQLFFFALDWWCALAFLKAYRIGHLLFYFRFFFSLWFILLFSLYFIRHAYITFKLSFGHKSCFESICMPTEQQNQPNGKTERERRLGREKKTGHINNWLTLVTPSPFASLFLSPQCLGSISNPFMVKIVVCWKWPSSYINNWPEQIKRKREWKYHSRKEA